MKTIGLALHPTNPKASEVAAAIKEHGDSRGLNVVEVDEEDSPDAILALGGDGTLLRAAQIAWHLDVPVMGEPGQPGLLVDDRRRRHRGDGGDEITDIYR